MLKKIGDVENSEAAFTNPLFSIADNDTDNTPEVGKTLKFDINILDPNLQDNTTDDFKVLTIATGRNTPAAMNKFFAEIGVQNLPTYRDPKQKLARDMAVLGLPASILISPDGHEIGRLLGDANWSDAAALTLLSNWTKQK